MATTDDLFLPHLVEKTPGTWSVQEVPSSQQAAVSNKTRIAHIPRAYTESDVLAQLHELTHVKHSPEDVRSTLPNILRHAIAEGRVIDSATALRINRMLEEFRIDWILWDSYETDARSAREVLDWTKAPAPKDTLEAVEILLQLAWTVWSNASALTTSTVPNSPPNRTPDAAAFRHYVKIASDLREVKPPLFTAMRQALEALALDPTDDTRDLWAARLAGFFEIDVPEEKPSPPMRYSERQQRARVEKEVAEQEAAQKRKENPADPIPATDDLLREFAFGPKGSAEIHDHTANIRRQSRRIARRDVPQQVGTRMVFPHRYLIDRSVFARRVLTEGGIMIDGSGSMRWSNEDLQGVLKLMPAVWVGIYMGRYPTSSSPVNGRICILAKEGRFSIYTGEEWGSSGGNDVDVEALEVLAKWPKPRLWLSDGWVVGGKYMKAPPIDQRWLDRDARSTDMAGNAGLIDRVNLLMRRHEIYRVANRQDMIRLLKRQRVTVYRTTMSEQPVEKYRYPDWMSPQPTVLQL